MNLSHFFNIHIVTSHTLNPIIHLVSKEDAFQNCKAFLNFCSLLGIKANLFKKQVISIQTNTATSLTHHQKT